MSLRQLLLLLLLWFHIMELITVSMGFEFVAGVVFIASGFSHEANFVLMIVGVPD
jgi:hypothetical protein